MPPDPSTLTDLALGLGAGGARFLPPGEVRVENRLAGLCRSGCANFGLAASCPPHVGGPGQMRAWLEGASAVLVARIELAAGVLSSPQAAGNMVCLHRVAAQVERAALEGGHPWARGLAGGSCKRLFCPREPNCAVLWGRPCRNPASARPSMSGFGVDVGRLFESAGWRLAHGGMASLAAMVVLG